jgi:hypothetical protein
MAVMRSSYRLVGKREREKQVKNDYVPRIQRLAIGATVLEIDSSNVLHRIEYRWFHGGALRVGRATDRKDRSKQGNKGYNPNRTHQHDSPHREKVALSMEIREKIEG